MRPEKPTPKPPKETAPRPYSQAHRSTRKGNMKSRTDNEHSAGVTVIR